MLRRVRRPAALVVPVLLLSVLAACGDDDGSGTDDALKGFDAISITGDVGTAPEVEWKGQLEAEKTETKVLVEGDGEKIKEGDKVDVNVWIGNGFLEEEVFTTYEKDGTPETFTVDDQLTPAFKDALLGQTIGSRVAVSAPAADVFGETGNPRDEHRQQGQRGGRLRPDGDVPAAAAEGRARLPAAEDRRGEGRRRSRSTSRASRSPLPTARCSATSSRRARARP